MMAREIRRLSREVEQLERAPWPKEAAQETEASSSRIYALDGFGQFWLHRPTTIGWLPRAILTSVMLPWANGDEVVCVSASDPTLYISFNAAASFTTRTLPESSVYDFWRAPWGDLYVGGNDTNQVYRSTDKGNSWAVVADIGTNGMYNFGFGSKGNVIAVLRDSGDANKVKASVSNDDGLTFPSFATIETVPFAVTSLYPRFVSGGAVIIYGYNDGGTHEARIARYNGSWAASVALETYGDTLNVWVAGDGQKVYVAPTTSLGGHPILASSDGGATFSEIDPPVPSSDWGPLLYDRATGDLYAVLSDGAANRLFFLRAGRWIEDVLVGTALAGG